MYKDRLKVQVELSTEESNPEEILDTKFARTINGVNQWKVSTTHIEGEFELLLYKSTGLQHVDLSAKFEKWAEESDIIQSYSILSYHKDI